jgi:hypothetical protein
VLGQGHGGVRHSPGATSALASARVRFGWDLGQLEPEFPAKTSPQERRVLITVFAGATAAITTEVNIDDILTRGTNPGQDSV